MTPRPSRTIAAPPADAASRTLRVLLVLVIASGMVLRCEGLGRKALWFDEIGTTLRLSGHTEEEVGRISDAGPRSPTDVLRTFQTAYPGALADGAAAVLRAVTMDEPLHSPGYYLAAYLWVRAVGDGRAPLRALSALASLAALALLGLLAWRLFRDRDVVLVTLALAAMSPLQIRYAQEARPYALWSVALLATLLATRAAAERPSALAWSRVTLALAAALYVHPLSLLVIPALLLLAVDAAGDQGAPPVAAAVAALGAAIVSWLPWVLVVLVHSERFAGTGGWMGDPFPAARLARAWFGVAASVLYRPSGPGGVLDGLTLPGTRAAWVALGILAAALLAGGLVCVAQRGPRAVRRSLPALALVPFASLALADVLLGGRRSTVDRYVLPAWIALELALAFLLAQREPRVRLRQTALALALVLGGVTAARSRPLELWWNTEPEQLAALGRLEAHLRALPAPIVVTDAPPLRVLELAHRLPDDASLRLGIDSSDRLASDAWARVVLVTPSADLLARSRAAAVRAGVGLVQEGTAPAWYAGSGAR